MTEEYGIVAAFLADYNSGDATQIARLFPADGWQEDVAPGRPYGQHTGTDRNRAHAIF